MKGHSEHWQYQATTPHQPISLDLDDGVKVNYARSGDLLADPKAVCRTNEEG